jgi:peptide/nickel transport system substrate-binding protein
VQNLVTSRWFLFQMHNGKTMVQERNRSLSNCHATRDAIWLTSAAMCATLRPHHRLLRSLLRLAVGILLAVLASISGDGVSHAEPRHAIAMHGEPALPADFTHSRYANPDAPKGGRLIQGVLGTFESINPFIARGLVAQGMRAPLVANVNIISGQVVESLMARGYDEPFTLYGLVARTIDTDEARSTVTFEINPAARFSDGKPVTPEDVLFSWELLRDKGRPNYRFYYSKVAKAEITGTHRVRFDLSGSNDRELPLILGLMPVLAKHAVNVETFEDPSYTSPVGTGPYIVGKVDPGKSVTLTRNKEYWGRDLAVNRGFWNFDEIRYDYYRDSNSHHEAFKRGLFDVRGENDPSRWQTGYDFPALREGRVVKETFSSGLPKPSFHFVFNTRRSIFADSRVREALALLFDFEWTNRNLFFGLYRRAASFFENSELSAYRRPADARERALLAPFPDSVRADVLDGTWSLPVTDGSGRDRTTVRRAIELLSAAGYELRGTELVERRSGKPFTFEITVANRTEAVDEERLARLYASNLKRAGINANVRLVDAIGFETRRIAFDFDMILNRWDQSLSPGNEQAFYWSSAAASENGSRNYMGVRSQAVDALIDHLIKAQARADVVAAARALDRVLMSGFYVVPLFYPPEHWVARWSTVAHPAETSLMGHLPETWWFMAK